MYPGYFSGWWKVKLVALLLMFLINTCVKNMDAESDFIPGDWNYDGKVVIKDLDSFIKWKIKNYHHILSRTLYGKMVMNFKF